MNSPPDITAVIDLGKSLIKVIYAIASDRPKILFLEPGVAELTKSECQGMQPSATASPEDDAWIELADGQRAALGFLAETQYSWKCDPKQGKYKSVAGALRCLAVIGAIAQRENLAEKYKNFDPARKNLALGQEARTAIYILLPIAEMPSRGGQESVKLKSDLASGLQSWSFRRTPYAIARETVEISVLPEGSGQLMLRQTQLGAAGFKKKNILLLIMGQYNVTAMLYVRGQCIRAESPSKGFHDLVKEVEASTSLDASAISSTKLIEAIYYGRSQPEKLRSLIAGRVDKPEHSDALVKEMRNARDKAFATYWKSVSDWLLTFLGSEAASVDEVLVSGGAAVAFKKQLEEFFRRSKIIWAGGIKQDIAQAFDLTLSDPMIYRLADAYGVFKGASGEYSRPSRKSKAEEQDLPNKSEKRTEATPSNFQVASTEPRTVSDTDSLQSQPATPSVAARKNSPATIGSGSLYERLRADRDKNE